MIICFSIHYNTNWGQKLCISGSIPELGNWNPEKAPEMVYMPGGTWVLKLSINTDFKYKYCIIDEQKNTIEWEIGKNRFFLNQPFIGENVNLIDSWRTNTNQDNCSKFRWKGAGVAIPVFSIRTKNSMGVGEFLDIKLLVDWAKITGLKMIQILPVNDTISSKTQADSSPYSTISVFALHPIYINIFALLKFYNKEIQESIYIKQEILNRKLILDYENVIKEKFYYIRKIYNEKNQEFLADSRFKIFFKQNKKWLVPYAAFCYLRDLYNTCEYSRWGKHKHLSVEEIKRFTSPNTSHYKEICIYYFIQYHLDIQLSEAAEYARKNKIILKGDIPIGVNRFSADTWTNPDFFNMNTETGAPPDDFSENGQNWQFPGYNWKVMGDDGYTWWQQRLKKMAGYFDGFRIDHILGFFRIWEIPLDCIEGVMGYFNPSLPFNLDELNHRGLKFDFKRYCEPYINHNMLNSLFAKDTDYVIKTFLEEYKPGFYKIKSLFKTQKQIEEYFTRHQDILPDLISNIEKIKKGLFKLTAEVLFIKSNRADGQFFHPRIDMEKTQSFKNLDKQTRLKLKEIYIDYFYKRHENFWRIQGMTKLPVIKNATKMLVCGEDLGMVPDCVPEVMEELGILSLNIQRMPKKLNETFNNPANNPYLSVCTTSSHDMPTIRRWWEQEDKEKIQLFFNTVLGYKGQAPDTCKTWICKEIIKQHLNSPSMWAVFPIQDILGINEYLRRPNTAEEQINNPANPCQVWNYRLHLNIEDLINEKSFNSELRELIELRYKK